jgi:hypothetical protein
VPDTASGLAELSVRDPHEPVGPRVEQHLLERYPAHGLLIGSSGDRHAGGLDARRELIPDALELAQVQQSRRRARARGLLIEPAHREGGHERIGELALEPVDLRPQRASRRSFILTRNVHQGDGRIGKNGA